MTISSLSSLSNIYATTDVSSLGSSRARETSALSVSDGCSTEISGPAKWMSELQSLLESDPEGFKQVTSSIAEKLREEANNTTGADAQFLNKLADQFEQASQDGDLSVLQPAGGPPPPPPPPPDDSVSSTSTTSEGVQKYASQQASSATSGTDELLSKIDQIIEALLQQQGITTSTTSGDQTLLSGVDQLIESELQGISS